jgi:hypothetical protein
VAYHWKPIQMIEHKFSMDFCRSLMNHDTAGTYVDTLSMCIPNKTFADAPSHVLRVQTDGFRAVEKAWCYVVGGSFVVCKGVLMGVIPREHDPESGRRMFMARLPVGCRPEKPLQFAAMAREVYGVGKQTASSLRSPDSPVNNAPSDVDLAMASSHLVTLMVTPDGWVSGISSKTVQVAVDLSAIRFCISRGVSVVDQVTLHQVDVAGTRMVTLQGVLRHRHFNMHSAKPLALLPESCQPRKESVFVVAGESSGGFHLVRTKQMGVHAPPGVGGEVMWADSVWNHDAINFTGIMYVVSDHAMTCTSLDFSWNVDTLKVVIADFQRYIIRRFGSLEEAWNVVFDPDGDGTIDFTCFTTALKMAGYAGSAARLWAALDEDRSGNISMDELFVGMGDRPP